MFGGAVVKQDDPCRVLTIHMGREETRREMAIISDIL